MNDVRITVRDLHKRYADHWVLQGVSFQVRRAEIACLIGPSGSASRPCCEPSTVLPRSTPAASMSVASQWVVAPIRVSCDATWAWCSRATTCSRT